MYEADPRTVLRCEQCNKPFDKESSLKRHGYYCRSRKAGSVVRSRSCISCARAKARCDNRRPKCSRCLSKAVTCQYPPNGPRGARLGNQYSTDDSAKPQQKVVPLLASDQPSVENHQEVGNDVDLLLDPALNISDSVFPDLGGAYFDPGEDFADFLNPQTNEEGFQYHSSELQALGSNSSPWADPTNLELQQAIGSHNISIPPVPSYNVRSFNQRPKLKPAPHRISNLILHNLKSYYLMMMHDHTLPPFIHPRLVSSEVENNDMEPLINCISLVHMLSNRLHQSRKLFWKNVRIECERFRAEHLQLNKSELLAAMQALFIYILVRLDEGETEHNNFDALLVATVTVIASRFNSLETDMTSSTQPKLYNHGLETSWKDWILDESARRLCVVYQVVNMLVYFEPAAMCNLHETDLLLAPLPAKKQLWEAGDERAWKAESERDPGGAHTAFGLAANGDLVRVQDGRDYCDDGSVLQSKSVDETTPTRSTAEWEEWCAGMDGFGGLVMLAASLVA